MCRREWCLAGFSGNNRGLRHSFPVATRGESRGEGLKRVQTRPVKPSTTAPEYRREGGPGTNAIHQRQHVKPAILGDEVASYLASGIGVADFSRISISCTASTDNAKRPP